ncbi:MAG TPA: efflux RND transporter periplasmic adaptor subunit [Verrucomicrobiae bacterium]|jgi:HlyD family secretion protein|nr:efflux RND transporter periplasmic adaptor subunit [Verrucomicrobiae bacterium]
MTSKLKRICWLATSLAITTLLLLDTGCKRGETAAEVVVSVQAAAAQRADISRVVTAEATIFPLAQSVITPKVSAPVSKFYVVRGQRVHKGQLLAVLENRDLAAAAMDNKGTFEQAQANYQISKGATLPEDAQKADADFRTAQQALDAEQKLYDSRENLYKQGALPRKDLDQARVSLVQAQSQFEAAKKHLEHLNALVKEQALKAAGGQFTSAQGKYLGAQAQLSYTQIHSPIDGVITDRPLYPGEMASTAAPLLTVMDLSGIIAKAHIPEADARLLHKGDKATLDVPGLDTVSGSVTVVSPALDPNSTTVEIWIQAKNPKQQLRPGTTARISITAQTAHDALVVPSAALLNANGDGAQVMVIDSTGTAQSRDIKIGIQSAGEAQIVSGLKAGEQVVTEGAYGLPDKTKVKVEKPAPATEAGKDSKEKDKD